MQRNYRPDNSNSTALAIIFDIICRIIFIYAAIVLIYWLFSVFVLSMGFRFPGYVHRSGINFTGGIAALILFVFGYIFELIRNAIIRN